VTVGELLELLWRDDQEGMAAPQGRVSGNADETSRGTSSNHITREVLA
jgi:hypothetical protein